MSASLNSPKAKNSIQIENVKCRNMRCVSSETRCLRQVDQTQRIAEPERQGQVIPFVLTDLEATSVEITTPGLRAEVLRPVYSR